MEFWETFGFVRFVSVPAIPFRGWIVKAFRLSWQADVGMGSPIFLGRSSFVLINDQTQLRSWKVSNCSSGEKTVRLWVDVAAAEEQTISKCQSLWCRSRCYRGGIWKRFPVVLAQSAHDTCRAENWAKKPGMVDLKKKFRFFFTDLTKILLYCFCLFITEQWKWSSEKPQNPKKIKKNYLPFADQWNCELIVNNSYNFDVLIIIVSRV